MRPGEAAARLDLAASLAGDGERVLLAWGGISPQRPVPAGVDLWPLPAAQASRTVTGLILDAAGRTADPAWKKRRAAALLALFAGMAPRLIVLDGAPSSFRFELRPLLEMARRRVPAPAIRVWPDEAAVGVDLSALIREP